MRIGRRGRRLTYRDVMCRLGLHWPLRWERRKGEGYEELLCQREDCRYRVRRRVPERELQMRSLAHLDPSATTDEANGR